MSPNETHTEQTIAGMTSSLILICSVHVSTSAKPSAGSSVTYSKVTDILWDYYWSCVDMNPSVHSRADGIKGCMFFSRERGSQLVSCSAPAKQGESWHSDIWGIMLLLLWTHPTTLIFITVNTGLLICTRGCCWEGTLWIPSEFIISFSSSFVLEQETDEEMTCWLWHLLFWWLNSICI